ncbi:NUDIX hydrolase [Capsaspora owczarzaki ATCC 30864]|uniref:NUDIX hydrolase n=1 Tax=Capsaspora owczarzaki (strain ATCC 30864) TaxID=595528 RepID=A0A0D2WJ39_CAPO3|nr:NUDIX hydrolase [Capsaspora owczarzaki ATCC 30864]KJE89233.1 NUDIX hydrolase [Capsaspora owczarzaki ATCC 30864]|eukprot:XP_004365617.1 NUDIX hydrolase [Capsaspora owczarzaki ATCC 30864]
MSTAYQRVADPSQGLSKSEPVAIVDEQDNVVDVVPRWRVRKDNLRHRATFIFVRHREAGKPVPASWQDELFVVQKRALIKDYCPGYLDACTGGVMQDGEEYEPSARRELEEELGISAASLTPLFHFLHEDSVTKVWGGAFLCDYTGRLADLVLQPEEVLSVETLTLGDMVARSSAGEPFTPDSMSAVKRYIAQLEAKSN